MSERVLIAVCREMVTNEPRRPSCPLRARTVPEVCPTEVGRFEQEANHQKQISHGQERESLSLWLQKRSPACERAGRCLMPQDHRAKNGGSRSAQMLRI